MRRRQNRRIGDTAGIDNKLPAGRAGIERYEQYLMQGCSLSRNGYRTIERMQYEIVAGNKNKAYCYKKEKSQLHRKLLLQKQNRYGHIIVEKIYMVSL